MFGTNSLISNHMGVVVAHPDNQHSCYLAAALEECGLLSYYTTRLYRQTNHPFFQAISLAPQSVRRYIEGFFVNRFHPGIPASKVQMYYTLDALWAIIHNYYGATIQERARNLQKTRGRFGIRAARLASRSAKAFVGYSPASVEAFQLAKANGLICILDQASINGEFARTLLQEEARLLPELAGYMNDSSIVEPEDSFDMTYRKKELELADYILTGSIFSASTFIKHGVDARKVHIIPYGVNIDNFFVSQNKKPGESFRIVFAGSISQLKGIYYLLEAVKRLNLPKLELLLCGSMVIPQKFLDRYNPYVQYMGRLSPARLGEIYRSADVLVFPSLCDGFGRVILEAMASGLCVITTPNTGGPDVIDEGVDGFITPIRDIEALMHKISLLYNDREQCRAMGIAARTKAKNWSWTKYNNLIGQFFHSILEK